MEVFSFIALFGIILKRLRVSLLTYISKQLDVTIGREILEKILFLPLSYFEKNLIDSQIAQVKDYDSLRNIITGKLINIIFDIPVAILFSIIMGFLAEILDLILIIIVILFLLFTLLFYKSIAQYIKMILY
ncbi:ABC transporter transmembrane domain-containing protein [Coxiella-like endosymbiont]|uniref:ABC transporter transmembrane domain-containing protein n=1 Tax=Coxiella-like endosymbiont TaxID=1592897 RepID=UPI00272DA1ED|nr:ABC transporter transmembrane domain-containing protein [Coxiella-like endosymbiont]